MLIINFLKALFTPNKLKGNCWKYMAQYCVILCYYMWYNEAPRTMFKIVLNIVIEGINGWDYSEPPIAYIMFEGEGGGKKKRKKNTFLKKLNNNLQISFSVVGKPTHYTWMYNKTSVWHIEVYELCSVIRAYFPRSGDWNLYFSSKQPLLFHFYFLRKSGICCLMIPKVLVSIQWIVKLTSCHLTMPAFLFVCSPPSDKV